MSSANGVQLQQRSLAETHSQVRIDPASMLHKCANPICTSPFRSLREGKLFLAELFPSDLSAAFQGNRRKLRRREHFWLCDVCAAHFTLRFDPVLGMLTVPIREGANPRFLARAAANV
jgi:hypothetical protein